MDSKSKENNQKQKAPITVSNGSLLKGQLPSRIGIIVRMTTSRLFKLGINFEDLLGIIKNYNYHKMQVNDAQRIYKEGQEVLLTQTNSSGILVRHTGDRYRTSTPLTGEGFVQELFKNGFLLRNIEVKQIEDRHNRGQFKYDFGAYFQKGEGLTEKEAMEVPETKYFWEVMEILLKGKAYDHTYLWDNPPTKACPNRFWNLRIAGEEVSPAKKIVLSIEKDGEKEYLNIHAIKVS